MAQVKNNQKLIFFWSLIGLATILFLVLMIYMGVKVTKYTSTSQLKQLKTTQVFTQKANSDGNYYVWFYSSETPTEQQEAVTKAILTYASYVKTHKSATPIYAVNVDNGQNSTCMTKTGTTSMDSVTAWGGFTLNWNDVSCLVTVTVSDTGTTYSTSNALTTEMDILSLLDTSMN